MPTNLTQLEDRLRAAYADAAATVQPDDIRPDASAATSQVGWHTATRIGATRIIGRRATALAAAAAVVLIIVVATVVPAVLQSGSGHRTGGPGIASSHMAYVVSQRDLLIPVNLATGTALKPIPLGVKGFDGGVVISPDNKLVYVVSVRGQLVPVDLATGKADRPIEVGGVPGGLVMTPNGRAAYVLEPLYGVVAVDLSTRTALGLIKIPGARSFVLTPDGKALYVLARVGRGLTLTEIDTATNTTIATDPLHGRPARADADPAWPVGGRPEHSHDGSGRQDRLRLVPIGQDHVCGRAYQVERVNHRCHRSQQHGAEADRYGPGPGPDRPGFAISPGSRTGYLTDSNSSAAQWVSPVDLRTGTVLPSIPLPANQTGYDLTLSPDGTTLYATAVDGSTVVPVDAATGTALQAIRLIGLPRWQNDSAVFAPGGETLYVLSSANNPRGALVAGRMTPINTVTGAVGKAIDFPAGLDDIVFGR